MFGCEDIFDKTDEYLDGGLSEVEYALFEEHLAVCEECRKNDIYAVPNFHIKENGNE